MNFLWRPEAQLISRRGYLFSTLAQIAFLTQHLTIFGYSAAALAPGGDMVGLHLFKRKFIAANGAFMALLFISGQGVPPVKSADGELALIIG